MFEKTSLYYDKIYDFKDYAGEVTILRPFIEQYKQCTGKRLLDVACGTGKHIAHLKAHFEVEGLDLLDAFVEIARQRNPEIPIHQGNMIDFSLGQQFDVIICLFSSIGYVQTVDNLERAVQTMADHLVPGGVLIIEPWFTPDQWNPGRIFARFIDEPEFKLVRMNTSLLKDRASWLEFHYLIGTPESTTHYVENHELALFTLDEMRASLKKSGLGTHYHAKGLTDRGLWIGQKPEG